MLFYLANNEAYKVGKMTNYILSSLIAVSLLVITAKAEFTPSERTCTGLDKKIKTLVSKMRAGYKIKQGERYRAKLKQFKNHRYQCKQKRFDVN